MPNKFKRNGKWTGQWHGQVKFQGRRFRSPLLGTREEALAWEVDMKRHLAGQGTSPTLQPIVTVSVIEWANRYLDYCSRYVPKTYSEKKCAFKRLIRFLGGDSVVDSITPGIALEHLQQQFREHGGSAANKEQKNLAAAWEWAAEYIDGFPNTANPFRKRKATTFPVNRKPRYVPPERDFWRVVEVAEGQDKALLQTLFLTGARIGELFGLRWDEVDFEHSGIILHTRKRAGGSREGNWLPMVPTLREVLLRQRMISGGGEWVFPQQEGRHKGQRILEYRGFPKALCELTGVKPFDCHGVRHLTATTLALRGVPQVVIKDTLRHTTLRMSDRYVHGPEDMRSYLTTLEQEIPTAEAQSRVQQ